MPERSDVIDRNDILRTCRMKGEDSWTKYSFEGTDDFLRSNSHFVVPSTLEDGTKVSDVITCFPRRQVEERYHSINLNFLLQ
jgi:hypothetical protein